MTDSNNAFLDKIIKYLWENKDAPNGYVQLNQEDMFRLAQI